jgi:hypothetical protein
MERNADIEATLGRMYDVFNTGDASHIEDFVSTEEDILGIGTDPREWWAGSAAVHAAWNTQPAEMHAAGLRFQAGDILAFGEGSVGWFADQPTLTMPNGGAVPMRLTGVVHKENGNWKIVQFHLSIGAMNEEALGEGLTT